MQTSECARRNRDLCASMCWQDHQREDGERLDGGRLFRTTIAGEEEAWSQVGTSTQKWT